MKLMDLRISYNNQNYKWDGVEPNTYGGKVRFAGKHGEVSIVLDGNQIEKILPIVAEALVAESKKVASLIATDVIEQVKVQEVIEDKSNA